MRHALTRQLPYAPEQLFALVGDVQRYPLFVPWITSLRAWNRRDLGGGVKTLDAEAEVRFSMVRERFATRVRLDAPSLTIDADLLSGPFRKLHNGWCFKSLGPNDDSSELIFEIDFEFGSRVLTGLLTANFDRAVSALVACFERRAEALYGPRRAAILP